MKKVAQTSWLAAVTTSNPDIQGPNKAQYGYKAVQSSKPTRVLL